ncbi:MAG: SDR family NAD(P)-dependent oxidoreductase, partial [Acaryochloris sp. SU_5_25]|nr:SDR family NAD(P)-dependent oxidoreductase [Acaryochloris sp. SU_5_25]
KQRIMQSLLDQGEKPTVLKVQRVYRQITASREIQETLDALAEVGSPAEYLGVDVTDAESLQEQIAEASQHLGTVTGMIHGAGNLADKLIEKKTQEDFKTVYAAKVQGLENLLTCIPPAQLDHLVLFSSVAGFYGNAGQTDYAIANEILNKSAYLVKQYHPECHVVAINWGPWDSGMVTPELKQYFAQRHIDVIPIPVGTQRLIAELQPAHHSTVQVVIGSPLHPAARGGELREYRIRRQIDLASQPFLQDLITTTGEVNLSVTFAASWMVNTCQQLHPSHQFSQLENLRVLQPIVCSNTQSREFILDLQEIASNQPDEIVLEAKIWSEIENNIQFYYSAQVRLQCETASTPVNALNLNHQSIFKPSFGHNQAASQSTSIPGIEQIVDLSCDRIITQCCSAKIPETQQGQFRSTPFNPYVSNLAIQSLFLWLKQFFPEGSSLQEIQQITQFKPLCFDQILQIFVETQLKTSSSVVCDVTVCDDQAQVYMHLSGIKVALFEAEAIAWKK